MAGLCGGAPVGCGGRRGGAPSAGPERAGARAAGGVAFMRMTRTELMTFWCETDSPVGRLLLAGDATGLGSVRFQSGPHALRPAEAWRESGPPGETGRAQ